MNQSADGGHLGFDAFREAELNSSATQVVSRLLTAEIDITFEVIGEKPQSQFEGDEANAIREVVKIPITEKTAGNGEVSRQDRLAEIEIELGIRGIQGLLTGAIATRTQAVPDVVMNKPRLDGIEVDQSNGMTGGIIDHHIVDFGVTVNRTVT